MPNFIQKRLLIVLILNVPVIWGLNGCSQMNGYVMNETGQVHYQTGNYQQAQRDFRRALMDDPTNPHYAYNLAAATHKAGDLSTAEQYYRDALQLNPSHQPAYHGLAALMMDQNRPQEARELIATWVGTEPYLAEPHIELAWLQQTEGDLTGAQQSLQQAIKINPRQDKAIAQLAQIYENQGNAPEAISLYQRSILMNPGQQEVQSRLATLKKQHPELIGQPRTQIASHRPPTQMGVAPMFNLAGWQQGSPGLIGQSHQNAHHSMIQQVGAQSPAQWGLDPNQHGFQLSHPSHGQQVNPSPQLPQTGAF